MSHPSQFVSAQCAGAHCDRLIDARNTCWRIWQKDETSHYCADAPAITDSEARTFASSAKGAFNNWEQANPFCPQKLPISRPSISEKPVGF
jgi:hypothetical protein